MGEGVNFLTLRDDYQSVTDHSKTKILREI